MPLTNEGLNIAANAVATAATHLSLHATDPGTSGAGELSGGDPAYARRPVSFGAANEGDATTTDPVEFNVPAGSTVAYVGFWSAATGGTFLGSQSVTSETYAGQGTYSVDSATIDFD